MQSVARKIHLNFKTLIEGSISQKGKEEEDNQGMNQIFFVRNRIDEYVCFNIWKTYLFPAKMHRICTLKTLKNVLRVQQLFSKANFRIKTKVLVALAGEEVLPDYLSIFYGHLFFSWVKIICYGEMCMWATCFQLSMLMVHEYSITIKGTRIWLFAGINRYARGYDMEPSSTYTATMLAYSNLNN